MNVLSSVPARALLWLVIASAILVVSSQLRGPAPTSAAAQETQPEPTPSDRLSADERQAKIADAQKTAEAMLAEGGKASKTDTAGQKTAASTPTEKINLW